MTDKEIDKRHFELLDIAIERAKQMGSSKREEYTDEEWNEQRELGCREMMQSIFCYHGIDTLKNEQSYFFDRYLSKYIKEFGRERFNQIRNEQIADYEKCTINYNVHEDSEGCMYNSINWNAA